jgi:hypothetical protein
VLVEIMVATASGKRILKRYDHFHLLSPCGIASLTATE